MGISSEGEKAVAAILPLETSIKAALMEDEPICNQLVFLTG
jgi:hypothetical protein